MVLNDFKNNGTHVLLATTTCGETGLNIPQANVVIIADMSWTPGKHIPYSRILRPQQTRKSRIYMLRAKGTIDEYMQTDIPTGCSIGETNLHFPANGYISPQ